MSPVKFFGLAALVSAIAFFVSVAVLNASCDGDFQCGPAGDDAWVAMVASAALGIVSLLGAGVSALMRNR
jgi:hypothetical protein